MFEVSKLLLDHTIDRRTFIERMSQAGVSLMGAASIADALGGGDMPAHEKPGTPGHEPGRILRNLTGGEVMAEFLIDWHVPYVFGLAGSEEVGFLDALVDRIDLQYCTCLHENAAMAMADGYSRSTGRTSIVQLHSVAGSAYALGQLVNSFRDRVPVVVVAGRQSVGYRGQDGFLEAANLHELPREYTQWVWDVLSPETIPEVLRRAFLLAEAPPGGPTFVTFSKDLWEMPVKEATIIPKSRSQVTADVAPSSAHVSQIVDSLLTAQQPVLFLGNEAIRYEVSSEVAGIAEAIGALVMTAGKIPCVFPTTHPNFAGEYLDDRSIIKDIDTFWALGAHMFRRGVKLDSSATPPSSATIIHTSLNEGYVARNYPVDIAAIAGIKATSAAVLQQLENRNLNSSAIKDRKRWIEEYSTKRRGALDAIAKKEWNKTPLSVSRLMIELNRQMDSEAYIVSEIVTADSYPRKYLDFDHSVPYVRRRRHFDTTGGVLGWGVAAAVGVKIGNPDKEVWCLTGDGSLNFGSQALWSAVRYEVPIGIVVFNNGQYQANRLNQNRYQGRMVETGKYIGIQLGHPDINYVSMATTYGIEAERIDVPKNLPGALRRCREAMQEGRPYLVDVVIGTFGQGKDTTWYDHFSVAKKVPRQS